MLSDSISDSKVDKQTWIIIVLIILSILVTCSEVFLRFGMLSTKAKKDSIALANCYVQPTAIGSV